MCGICGVVYKDGLKTPSEQTLQAMNNTISHRGPDDAGVQVFSSAGLAMRRLSIIDLYTGHQPLSNEDQTLTIVFNGEIYNFSVLKQQLQDQGHTFKTSTDTEVIVHGYEEWGEDVCKKLNGMFAFAIWDDKRKKLMLARDRIGIKPLYYYEDEEKLVFGSGREEMSGENVPSPPIRFRSFILGKSLVEVVTKFVMITPANAA